MGSTLKNGIPASHVPPSPINLVLHGAAAGLPWWGHHTPGSRNARIVCGLPAPKDSRAEAGLGSTRDLSPKLTHRNSSQGAGARGGEGVRSLEKKELRC